MASLAIANYSEYYDAVIHDGLPDEWEHLLELLVICESGFFRHPPSFAALQHHVLPELADHKIRRGDNSLAMWSAGSSRGQEPYSLAMCFYEFEEHGSRVDGELIANTLDMQVLGTDISRKALARAIKGEYSRQELRNLPETLRDKYFTPLPPQPGKGKSDTAAMFRINDKIRRRVRFQHMNLRHAGSSFIPFQDVIFCQNVFVYFAKSDRAKIIHTFLSCLSTGGYLFIGPGESIGIEIRGAAVKRFDDAFAYQRNQEPIHVHVAE